MEEYKEIKSLEINIQDYVPVHQRAASYQKDNSIDDKEFILATDEVENTAEEIIQKQEDIDIINSITDIMNDDDIL